MNEQLRSALEAQNPWWFGKTFDSGIKRLKYYPKIMDYLTTPEVLLLIGARRTGKTTLSYQVIKKLLKQGVQPKAILFINLDEPILQSETKNPGLLTNLIDTHVVKNKGVKNFYVFIDEIQNNDYWIETVKTFYDTRKNIKLVLTGSTSKLIEGPASTKLSGRYFSVKIFPLTFIEYLEFTNTGKKIIEQKEGFNNYLRYGGFPRVTLEPKSELKTELLKKYFQTIYLKDIVYLNKIRNNKDVFNLLYYAISNVSNLMSYNKLASNLDLSADTVKDYMAFSENSHLLFMLNKYDPSVKKQLVNPKKIYCLDTGLINAVSFKFSENKGRILENLVFINLIKQQKEVYYHKETYECDFLIKDGLKITQAIQVTQSLKNESTRKREIKGLIDAMNKHGLKKGLILTEDETDMIKEKDKKIIIKPIRQWLLED